MHINKINFKELNDVSWSNTKINDQDIEYILSEPKSKLEKIEANLTIPVVRQMLFDYQMHINKMNNDDGIPDNVELDKFILNYFA